MKARHFKITSEEGANCKLSIGTLTCFCRKVGEEMDGYEDVVVNTLQVCRCQLLACITSIALQISHPY